MVGEARGEATDSRISVGRYLPVPLLTLGKAKHYDFDLYQITDPAAPPVLYREKSYPISKSDIDRLVEQGAHTLYVRASSHAKYQTYLRDNLQEFLADESMAPQARYEVLCETASEVLRQAFATEGAERVVTRATEFSRDMVGLLADRNVVAYDLFLVMHHDYLTFAHSINVSTYSVLLAEKLGIQDKEDLEAIATGALLHDIGKLHLPASLLNTDDTLASKRQREQLDRHPQSGFEELCDRNELTWSQLMMVYQHHERVDGQGYPVQLVGAEVHEWARLCAVANAFDRLSSRHGQVRGFSAPQALERLMLRAGTWYDKEMVRCLVAIMESRSSTAR